jgi:hypothetical protein
VIYAAQLNPYHVDPSDRIIEFWNSLRFTVDEIPGNASKVKIDVVSTTLPLLESRVDPC